MTTKEQTKEQPVFKSELLKDYVSKLKQNGFKVYTFKTDRNEPILQVFIVKDNNIGTVEEDYFGGLNFGTVNKPSREHGTGYRTNDKPTITPTIKDALNTFILKPHWASGTPVKYKDWEEYLNTPINKILTYYEVKNDNKRTNKNRI